MEVTDPQLIAGIQKGDERSLELLFKRYYDPLCRFAFTYLKSQDEVKDEVMDLFTKLWDQRESLKIKSAKEYLFSATKRKCLNYIRKNKTRDRYKQYVTYLPEGSSHSPEEVMQGIELKAKVDEIIFALPPKCREVFKLRYLEQLSRAEIGEKMGISVKAVDNHIRRAKDEFELQLGDLVKAFLTFLFFILNS